MDNNFDDEILQDDQFESFMEYLKELHDKDRISVINPTKLNEFKKAYVCILKTIKDENSDAKISYKVNLNNAGEGVIVIEADEIIIRNIQYFSQGIKAASNFEIYPLKNGMLRMSITFYGIMIEIITQ